MFKIGEYGFFFLILFSPPRWTTSKGKDILVSYSAHGKCNFIRQKSTCQRRDIQPHNWSLKWTRAWELSFSEDRILTLNLFERCKRRCFKLSFKRNNIRQHWNLRIHCPFIEIKRSEYWPILPFKTEVEVTESFSHYGSRVVWNGDSGEHVFIFPGSKKLTSPVFIRHVHASVWRPY